MNKVKVIYKCKMRKDQKSIEEILVKGLSHVLRRTVEVNPGDQLAIAQEYKEWKNCISSSFFLCVGVNRAVPLWAPGLLSSL